MMNNHRTRLPRFFRSSAYLWIVAFSFLAAAATSAHEQNATYTTLTLKQERLEVEFGFRPADLVEHFSLDTNGDEQVDDEELRAGSEAMFAYIEEHSSLGIDFAKLSLDRVGSRFIVDDNTGHLAIFAFEAELDPEESFGEVVLDVDFGDTLGPQSFNFAKLSYGDRLYQDVLVPDDSQKRFRIGEPPSLWAQFGLYVILGIEHIFIGFDHILFLIALIAVGGSLKNLIKIVTAFTVAHSITLILAALEIVMLPSRLVEAGIALSIAYVAAENFWQENTDHRWILTFIFGLVHGFGFANVLRELGLPSRGLVTSLLAFNIGVEIGQVCIVLLCFPLVMWLAKQKFRKTAVRVISGLIFAFGVGWLIERVFDLGFMPI